MIGTSDFRNVSFFITSECVCVNKPDDWRSSSKADVDCVGDQTLVACGVIEELWAKLEHRFLANAYVLPRAVAMASSMRMTSMCVVIAM